MTSPPDLIKKSRQWISTLVSKHSGPGALSALTRPLQKITETFPQSRLSSVVRSIADIEVARLPTSARWIPSGPIITFILFVILPSIACQIYLIFVASDQYIAESRFAVRAAETTTSSDQLKSDLAALASGTINGPSLAGNMQNAYIVAQYIRSRAAVVDLRKTVDLNKTFRPPEADFWVRMKKNANLDEIYDFWLNHVNCYVDSLSGIVRLQVRAFRPQDAVTVSDAVLKLSEQLINDMSTRAKRDSMRDAEEEVQRADGLVRTALAALRTYRDSEGLIDPVKSADETGKLIMQLLTEKIKLESELYVVERSLTKGSPVVTGLRNRLDSIDAQLVDYKNKLTNTSSDAKSVSSLLSKYEELETQRQFSLRLYEFAQDGLERARVNAARQALYLTVFVPASMPEESTYPKRYSYSIILPLVFLVFWSIATLVWLSIEDHRL
jgi:capsular polysaccharide transport system permease protein